MSAKKPVGTWKRLKRRLTVVLAVLLGPGLLRLLAWTWRVERRGQEVWSDVEREGMPPVFAMWHASIPTGAALHRHLNLAVMISRHHDGEIIARIVERLGYQTVRGSTFEGGFAALREMRRMAGLPCGLVLTPDGPRGPARSIAPGILHLPAATGRPLVAAGFAASSAWHAGSWDRMMIPKPFSRVAVVFELIQQLSRDEVRTAAGRQEQERLLRQGFERAEAEAVRLVDGGAG